MSKLWGFSDFFLQNPILLLTLIAHVLADFQWQSQKIADLKSRKLPYLMLHLIIVFLPLLMLSVLQHQYRIEFHKEKMQQKADL